MYSNPACEVTPELKIFLGTGGLVYTHSENLPTLTMRRNPASVLPTESRTWKIAEAMFWRWGEIARVE